MALDLQSPPISIPLATDSQGVVRVAGTRVTLDTVVGTFDDGATAEEIVQRYPSLRLADVHAVIAYYLDHRAKVRDYMAQRERASADVQRQMEALYSPDGIRERLLARRPPT
jgi:uncharacterized protein (DUF433 family)